MDEIIHENIDPEIARHLEKGLTNRTYGSGWTPYVDVPQLCRESGYGSVRELFADCGLPILPPDEQFALLISLLDGLSEYKLMVLNDIICEMAADSCLQPEVRVLKPTHRAFWILKRALPRNERRTADIPQGLSRAWKDQKMGTKIKTAEFPEIAKYFSVSLRWLLGYDETDELFYCKDKTAERIVDTFSFLYPGQREYFLAACRAAGEGQNNG